MIKRYVRWSHVGSALYNDEDNLGQGKVESVVHSCSPLMGICSLQILRQTGRRTIQAFLKAHKCYDVLRQSGKVGGARACSFVCTPFGEVVVLVRLLTLRQYA